MEKQEWRPLPQKDTLFFFFFMSAAWMWQKSECSVPSEPDLHLICERPWGSNADSVRDGVGGSSANGDNEGSRMSRRECALKPP